jgi:stage V sporulation protein D (sporulation-specific penicillin-binding protein)
MEAALRKNVRIPKKRIIIIFVLASLLAFLLLIRLFWLQGVNGSLYTKMAVANRLREIEIYPKRGDIYDRTGHVLAISNNAESLYAIPQDIQASDKKADILDELSAVLKMNKADLNKKLAVNKNFVWLNFKLDQGQTQTLKKLKLPGVGLSITPQRYYPNGSFASQVIGIAGDFNQGLEGVEASYDRVLAGTAGKEYVECDAAGRPIPDATDKIIGAKNGENVVLTVDQNIQQFAETALDDLVKKVTPKSATIVVLDPKTGEVLAMVNRPNFDPNNYKAVTPETRRNLAVNSIYEPGSTFKVVTLGAALDEGVAHDNDTFYCPGYKMVTNKRVNCWYLQGHGKENLAQIVSNSCNPGFMTLGLELGTDKLYKYINAFGMGKPLGIDLPGESSGIVIPEKDVRPLDLATISIGQVNAATPLQIVSAMATVANGGELMKPCIVKNLTDDQGQVVKTFQPTVIRNVLSDASDQKEKALLQGVVDNGTGSLAKIDGYTVAGKTGTAEKPIPGGGYSPTDMIVSFCGFAPVDNPRVAVLVVVDTPHNVPIFGGTICGPVFRSVVENSLRYLQVPRNLPPTASASSVTIPRVVNLTLPQATQKLNLLGLLVKTQGTGPMVIDQNPLEGSPVVKNGIVYLSLKGSPTGSMVMVPQLRGLTIRDAADLLASKKLNLVPAGQPNSTGIASAQDPPAGSYVVINTTIKVSFKPATVP